MIPSLNLPGLETAQVTGGHASASNEAHYNSGSFYGGNIQPPANNNTLLVAVVALVGLALWLNRK